MSRYVFAALLFLMPLLSTSEVWGKAAAEAVTRKADGKKTLVSKRLRKSASIAKPKKARASLQQTARKKGRTKSASARSNQRTIRARAARAPRTRTTTAPTYARHNGIDAKDRSLNLNANAALVLEFGTGKVLFEKNAGAVLPIASITKLMTALVVVESRQDMDEVLTVTTKDIDRIKHTSSRLRIGSKLTRANMLHIALMSSENRAASALGRHYPGGLPAFVAAMNAKAKALDMTDTRYVEPTGLSSENVSNASDLAKLVLAAQKHPLIREYSTNREYEVEPGGSSLQYRNSNRLIANSQWDILLQKTGYISEAGRCLVMNARIDGRSIVMVFLDAKGKYARATAAGQVRKWLESVGM